MRTIIEMVNLTRFDCVLGSAGLMRRAVAEATHHAAHRSAFGRLLAEQPLMQNVLADLCLELGGRDRARAAAGARARRGRPRVRAGSRSRSRSTGSARRRRRSSPRRSSASAGTATSRSRGLPRLYREAPLNSLWEGAGNVNSLDVLRAAAAVAGDARRGARRGASCAGDDDRLDAAVGRSRAELARRRRAARARRRAARAARCRRRCSSATADPAVAELFCATRLGGAGRARVRDAAGDARPRRDRRARDAAPASALT